MECLFAQRVMLKYSQARVMLYNRSSATRNIWMRHLSAYSYSWRSVPSELGNGILAAKLRNVARDSDHMEHNV